MRSTATRVGSEPGIINLYLCGCCDLVRSVYEHSDLFRIGGDEFVVILENEDYDKRTALEEKLSEKIAAARSREDVSPWERYSISVGMADCEPDSTFDQVVKHADEIMYKAKQEYKKKHGSYR